MRIGWCWDRWNRVNHILNVILALEARIQSRQPHSFRLAKWGQILGTSPSMTAGMGEAGRNPSPEKSITS